MGLLVLGIAAMFWKTLFTSRMFYFRDVYNFTYPHAKFIHDAIRHGHLPYWNPLVNYGELVLADPNFLFFYPTTLLIVLLPAAYAYCLHYVLHFAIAAVGTYCLARRWNQSRGAALFAAAAFAFSGPLLSLGNFYNQSACTAWIPWALLATEVALRSRSVRPWIALSGLFALQFLAGEMFTLLATFILCFAYALFQAGSAVQHPASGDVRLAPSTRQMPRTSKTEVRATRFRLLAVFAAVGFAMTALCAVQLLPAAHLLATSRRGIQGMPYGETTYWSFHPLGLIESVLPGFFGWPLSGFPPIWDVVLNGRNDSYLLSIFTGFVALFFALVGWAFGRDRRTKFLTAAAVVLVLLSFGRFTPLFALAYLLFPPLELVRFPVKLLVPATLLVALLAGWGLDALRDPKTGWRRQRARIVNPLACLLTAVVIVLGLAWMAPWRIEQIGAAILAFSNRLYTHSPGRQLTGDQVAGGREFIVAAIRLYFPGLAGYLLGGLMWLIALEQKKAWARKAIPAVAVFGIAHLVWVNYSVNPTVPKAFYRYQPPVLADFQPAGKPYRVGVFHRDKRLPHNAPNPGTYVNFDSIPFVSRLSPAAQSDFRGRLTLARGTMLTGAEVVSNNDVDLSMPSELFHFWVFVATNKGDVSRVDCLIGRTNVKYEIFGQRQRSSTLHLAGRIFNGSSVPSYLYENTCFVPRTYAVGSAVYSPTPLATLKRLSEPGFDPMTTVILPGSPGIRLAAGADGADLKGLRSSAGTVTIVRHQPNEVLLRVRMVRQGYVILLDRYDSGWRAWVDGRPAPILRANLMFRAVQVNSGEHLVRFEYHQLGLRAGLAITAVTLILLLGIYAADRVRLSPLITDWTGGPLRAGGD